MRRVFRGPVVLPDAGQRRSRLPIGLAALVVSAVLASGAARGGDRVHEGIDATAGVTLTQGMAFRASKREEGFAGTNNDDGDRNYDRGLVSNTSSVTAELELARGDLGLFARVHGFVDYEARDGERARTPLSDEAGDIVGSDVELLDLYMSGAFDPGGMPLDLRIGNQVLNWGESTFIQGGVNVINPYDVSRLRVPGSELRNALLPVPMAAVAVEPSPGLSVEGFYQFGWEETEVDPVGTYFSSNDYVGAGGRHAFLSDPALGEVSDRGRGFMGLEQAINADLATARGAAQASYQNARNANDPRALAAAQFGLRVAPRCALAGAAFAGADCQLGHDPHFLALERAPDREAGDSGQWGLALRYFSEALNDTEFGFYFINAHSRLPLVTGQVGTAEDMVRSAQHAAAVSAQGSRTAAAIARIVQTQLAGQSAEIQQAETTRQITGLSAGLAIDRFAKSSRYFVQYPEDLQTVGISFNTALGTSGWALQGEYSFRPDAPLQREGRSLFAEALAPARCFLEESAGERVMALPKDQRPTAAILACAVNPEVDMTVLGKVLQGHVERDVSQAQATATRIFGPLFGSDSTAFIAEAAVMHVHDMPDRTAAPLSTAGREEIADATSWGYQGALGLDYNNAVGAVKLSPYLRFQHDVSGSSPAPSGPFVDGRKVVTLGLGANYLERWSADLSYTKHAPEGANYLT